MNDETLNVGAVEETVATPVVETPSTESPVAEVVAEVAPEAPVEAAAEVVEEVVAEVAPTEETPAE